MDVSESCLSAYCDHVLEQLNKGNTKELSKAEDEEFLKCLKALADLKEPEWKRVFSSKVFEMKSHHLKFSNAFIKVQPLKL